MRPADALRYIARFRCETRGSADDGEDCGHHDDCRTCVARAAVAELGIAIGLRVEIADGRHGVITGIVTPATIYCVTPFGSDVAEELGIDQFTPLEAR